MLIEKLRSSNTAKEQICLDLETKLAEQRKQFNHKRIECESLQKSSGDKVAYLEKKVDMLTEQNDRLGVDLDGHERKLAIANEVALGNRKLISEQANKIHFLECDLEVKHEEAEQLKADKARLQEKLNDTILQVSN